MARLHLMKSVRSTSTTARHQTIRVYEHQENQQITLTESPNYKYFSRAGWALMKRKHNNAMSTKVKDYIEKKRIESQENKSSVCRDYSKRNQNIKIKCRCQSLRSPRISNSKQQ